LFWFFFVSLLRKKKRHDPGPRVASKEMKRGEFVSPNCFDQKEEPMKKKWWERVFVI
jgi:hypothetical protein